MVENIEESRFFSCDVCDSEIGDYNDMLNDSVSFKIEYDYKVHICEDCVKKIARLGKEKNML